MKLKTKLKLLIVFSLFLSISCEGDLESCVTTVYDGPNNTNCREEPNFDSGCFPTPDTTAQKETLL